jgi:4-alpha-glucanotransferase
MHVMDRRGSGILLHVTSLSSPFGIGDFGAEAYRFVDFLKQAKQSYWQILPLGAVSSDYNPSPYHIISAFAFNKFLISPELMVKEGLLNKADLDPAPGFSRERVDYKPVIAYKKKLFHKAICRFRKQKNKDEYEKFCSENSSWIDDFALFVVLKSHFRRRVWNGWPSDVRDRKREALELLGKDLQAETEIEKFLQFIFFKQWVSLKNYCHEQGIHIIGDMPIYVDYDSVDCWTRPDIFKLDKNKKPIAVSGVPPDYFSRTGQLWGNPIYRWDVLKKRKYDWWIQRIEQNLKIYDIVRVDHFRGFVGYWEVPAAHRTAIRGKWIKAPALDFFNQLNKKFRFLPIIAEDLGTITPDVKEVMHHFRFPGMKVLLFALGEDYPMHPYLPHTYEKNYVVYTGTHDNNTVKGWFEGEAKPEDKMRLFRYLGQEVSAEEVNWAFIRLAMMSVANTAIIPIQDVLGSGKETRMNKPATKRGNWQWRLLSEQMTSSLARKLSKMTEIYGRG